MHRDPAARGVAPLLKRWVAEQVYGTLMWHRRLVRDFERSPTTAQSRIYWAMTANMTRRLTRTATPAQRPAAAAPACTLAA